MTLFNTAPNSPIVGLAPMEGVSDLAFRTWIQLCSGPKFMSTPFLRVTATYPKKIPIDFIPELNQDFEVGYKLIPQLMAADPHRFSQTAKLVLQRSSSVDLNCGCPAPKPVGSGAGSSLLKNSIEFRKFLQLICESLPAQALSVKIRLGFMDKAEFPQLMKCIADLPLAHLSIHGRTATQRYSGHADWKPVMEAAKYLPFPVVGSGDINSKECLDSRFGKPISGIMIGRGAIRNPWIFESIRTGSPQQITIDTLIYCLSSYTILAHLLQADPMKLITELKLPLLTSTIGTQEESWQRVHSHLTQIAFGSQVLPEAVVANRFLLGRTKMVWNYLRSSLPPIFFKPEVLRSKNYDELYGQLRKLAMDFRDENQTPLIPVAWDVQSDLIYSSKAT